MRDIKVIEAEIAKLQAERADAAEESNKRSGAVNILLNLGWKREGGRWVSPAPKPEVKLNDYKAPVKAGDLCEIYIDGHTHAVYVHTVNIKWSEVSYIKRVWREGCHVDIRRFHVRTGDLTVRPREYFIGKTFPPRF